MDVLAKVFILFFLKFAWSQLSRADWRFAQVQATWSDRVEPVSQQQFVFLPHDLSTSAVVFRKNADPRFERAIILEHSMDDKIDLRFAVYCNETQSKLKLDTLVGTVSAA